MKRLIVLMIIMLLLGGAAYYIKNKENPESRKSTLDLTDRAFAVEDVSEIAKITLQKGYQDGHLLERKGEKWFINHHYEASPTVVNYLLSTINRITIQNIPNKNAVPTILDEMERIGIKVKIYDKNDQQIRSFIVGTQAYDDMGVSMLVEGKNQPYNMFIPGFEGELRGRFLIKHIDDWRAKRVFEAREDEIEKITVEYKRRKSDSFVIDNTGSSPTIKPLSKFVKKDEPFNPRIVVDYMKNYRKLYAENFDNYHQDRDSISNLEPFAIVTLKTKNADPVEVNFHSQYEIMVKTISEDLLNNKFAVERFYADMSTGDFMLVQGGVFNPIFRTLDYFYQK